MPDIAGALKAEIGRLARKELRSHIEPLKKQLASHRAAIAVLRKQVLVAQRKAKAATKSSLEKPDEEDGRAAVRFSAKGFAAHRQRLGISAADMAKLLGVSQLSVYKWESGKTRPRSAQLQSIAAVRKLGKKEARRRLDELAEPALRGRKAA